MPRGIYDRSKMKKNTDKPEAKAEKTPAKKVVRRRSPGRTTISQPNGSSWPAPMPAPGTVDNAPVMLTRYAYVENGAIKIANSLDEAVKNLVDVVGMKAEDLISDPRAQILTFQSPANEEAPLPKNVRLTYTV